MTTRRRKKQLYKIVTNTIKTILVLFFFVFILVVFVQRVTKNNFAIGGFRVFTVVSGSMEPRYKIGDILIVKNIDHSEIKVGDDLCYLGNTLDYKDKVITHEVKSITETDKGLVFETEGLANVLADPMVSESQVYGIVVYKTVVFSFVSRVANNKVGFVILVFIPLVLFIILETRDIVIEVNARMNKRARKLADKDE